MQTATSSRLAVLLFTDLVGSTEMKSRLGTAVYAGLLSRHDALFKQIITQIPDAQILEDTGDGYFAAFTKISDAVRFALRFQQALRDEPWGAHPLRTRVGIDVGEVVQMAGDGEHPKLIGVAADLASRVTALAQGGQILLTRVAFNEARQFISEHPDEGGGNGASPRALRWMAHGNYLIKGHIDPVEVFEVGAEGVAPFTPPADKEHAKRSVSAEQEETLGWRPAAGLAVPQRTGWALEKKLGEGTFGEVWLARSERTKEARVFKFCFDAERLRSFKRELTFFRLIRDALGERRDIARLYDVRLDEQPFFLESEYAAGGNLIEWSETQGGLKQIPLATRLDIFVKVCDAVAAAHSVGILHKDIKPSNILVHLDRDGSPSPQLSDFGIGLLTDPEKLKSHRITQTGFTLLGGNESSRTGTRMYAPPESLINRPFTTQGDIYALGVLLYQMTIGDLDRPLAEGWEREVTDELLREDIAACTEGKPDRRLSSATELSRRLRAHSQRRAAREQERRAAEQHLRRARMARAGLLMVAACVLIAVLSLAGWYRERVLREALTVSEGNAKAGERKAQLSLLADLVVVGDSRMQSKLYDQATIAYENAWVLAGALKEPPLPAISGLVQARTESPSPLFNRRPSARADDRVPPIARVRVSPNGKLVAAGDGLGNCYILELPTARKVAALPVKGWAYGIALIRNGEILVTAGSQGQIQTWDVGKWDKPREAAEVKSLIYALACAPDGRSMVTVEPSHQGRATGRILFWSIDPLRQVGEIATPAGVLSVAYSPDGKYLATGDEKGAIALRSAEDGSVIGALSGHRAEVVALAFTPDGRRLLSGSYDKTVRLWDVAQRKEVFQFTGHLGRVRDVCVSHDGKIGASASSDELLKVWDLEEHRELTTLSRHTNGATSVDFMPDGSGLISGGENGRVAAWDLSSEENADFALHEGSVSGVCVLPDGLTALTAGADGKVSQVDVATGRVLRSVTTQPVSSLSLARQARTALVGQANGATLLLNMERFTLEPLTLSGVSESEPLLPTTALVTSSRPANNAVSVTALSADGSAALIGGWDSFSVVRLSGGGFARHGGRIMAGCFTPDGKHVLAAVERDLYLLETGTGRQVQRIPTPMRLIDAVAISPDGKLAATAGFENVIRIWDLESRLNIKMLRGHTGWVHAVAFLPDGKSLVSGSQDNTVRLWDLVNPVEMRCFRGHENSVTAVAVNGSTILSADSGGIVRKWDLSRPSKYRDTLHELPQLALALDANGSDPAALKALGEWYAFRARDEWAIDCLERARSGGENISPLMLARCYWRLNRLADAAREFQSAAQRKEVSPEFLNLCAGAVKPR